MSPLPRFALFLSACLLAACGGGGDGNGEDAPPTGPESVLLGDYAFASIRGHLAADSPSVASSFGPLDADGRGTWITSLTANADGTVGAPEPLESSVYRVGADRSLSIFPSSAAATPSFEGGVTPNGIIGILVGVADGTTPELALALRREGPATLATLSGAYHAVAWAHDLPAGTSSTALWGDLVSDGAGSALATLGGNTSGNPGTETLSTTYTVGGDGSFALALQARFTAIRLEGAVRPDGQVAVASGGTADTNLPMLWCLLKKTTGANASLLSGAYHAVTFAHSGQDYSCSLGTMTFDGMGTWSGTRRINQAGSESQTGTEDGDYDVDPDGRLVWTIGAGFPFEGGVSASGDFAMFAGSSVQGTPPQLYFLIRK